MMCFSNDGLFEIFDKNNIGSDTECKRREDGIGGGGSAEKGWNAVTP